jgi:hypothetical protein
MIGSLVQARLWHDHHKQYVFETGVILDESDEFLEEIDEEITYYEIAFTNGHTRLLCREDFKVLMKGEAE